MITHSHGFKKPTEFPGKKVVVVGLGNTAADMSTTLVDLRNNSSIPLPGIREFIGPDEVVLEDGSIVEVDVVICCTGYPRGFELIPELQPEPNTPLDWISNSNSNDYSFPRLYQNLFCPIRGDTIAFLNNVTLPQGAFHIAELAAMAVVQTWKGDPPLLSQEVINKAIDAHHEWMTSLMQKETVMADLVLEDVWIK
jgi:dimethylaniline monooxygenase (N-oxide forming)